jgi:hypothetical protein
MASTRSRRGSVDAPRTEPNPDPIPAGLVEKTALYCVNPIGYMVGQFDAGYLGFPSTRASCRDLWREKSARYRRHLNPPRSILDDRDLGVLDPTGATVARHLRERMLCYPDFELRNVQFYNVPLRKLITPQLTVTDSRVDAHTARISRNSNEEQKLEFVSGRGPREGLVDHQVLAAGPGGRSDLFTTQHDDVRMHFPPRLISVPMNDLDPEGGRVTALAFPIGEGFPIVHAYKFKMHDQRERLILANGVHRVVAAIRSEVDSLPIAVCDAEPGDLPEPFVDLSINFATNPQADPPLAGDFLDSRIAMHLGFFPGKKAMRFNWSVEQATVLDKRGVGDATGPTTQASDPTRPH